MIIVQSTFHLRPEALAKALLFMENMQTACQKEFGCISYEYFQSISDPNQVVLMQEWESAEDLQGHYQTEHMADFLMNLGDCLSADISTRRYVSRDESAQSSIASSNSKTPERTMH